MAIDKIRQISLKSKKIIVILTVLSIGVGLSWYLLWGEKSANSRRGGAAVSENEGSNLPSEPDRDADIYGMITSVKGNQITILKFDPSTMPGAKKNTDSKEDAATEENAISLGQTDMASGPGGGRMPSGGVMPSRPSGTSTGGPFDSAAGGGESTTRESKLEELKANSIGTETITVPVGIPISIRSDAAASSEAGNLTDLTSDTMVVLWLKIAGSDTTQSVAEFINVTGKVEMDNSNN